MKVSFSVGFFSFLFDKKKNRTKITAVPAPYNSEPELRRSHYKNENVARNYISMPRANELFVRLKAFCIKPKFRSRIEYFA